MNLATLLSAILGFLALAVHGAPTNIEDDWDFVGPDHSAALRERAPANLENNSDSANATFPAPLQKRNAWCETQKTTWDNRISDKSSLTVHCEKLARNIKGDATWYLLNGLKQTLATYKSCAFGATQLTPKYAWIGNEDIRSLVWGSIDRFHSDQLDGWDRVQAQGDMHCLDFESPVNWGIYPIKGTWPMPDPDAEKDDKLVEGPVEWVETEGYTLDELEMLFGQ